jgi:hypothetical protein
MPTTGTLTRSNQVVMDASAHKGIDDVNGYFGRRHESTAASCSSVGWTTT